MAAQQADGKQCFLIDGFPRNLDNVQGWQENVGDGATVHGVLYYEAKEDELEKRLLGRGETSGRSDDNLEVIKKRFATYVKETQPIIESCASAGEVPVFTIDGMPPIEEVWKETQAVVDQI